MPIYEYRCEACGNEHEAIRKFSDAPLTTCPACGKETLVKKVSAAGFQLKGSGWYQTDFRGGNKPAAPTAAKPDAAAGSAASAGESKTTESAPAAKAESSTPASDTKSAPSSGTAAAS
jgi:putative FmdB family regulatory protein